MPHLGLVLIPPAPATRVPWQPSSAPVTAARLLLPPCKVASVDQPTAHTRYTKEDLMSLKVVELQALLAERQLAKSGKKEVLVDRLLAAGQLAGFEAQATQPMAADASHSQQAESVQADGPAASVRRRGRPRASARPNLGTSDIPAQGVIHVTDHDLGPQQQGTGLLPAAQHSAPVRTRRRSHKADVAPDAGQDAPAVGQQGSVPENAGRLQHAPSEPSSSEVQGPGLGPMPVLRRGRNWALQQRPDMDNTELKALLQSNPQDLQLTLLGTAADVPTASRALACVALLRSKDVWLFDCGDDTQRQLGVVPHIKPSKLFRIFITRLCPETLLGLPGLLCTIGTARVKGHEKTDVPLHVYGPRGLAEYLATIFKVSNTYLEINVLVVELADTAVPEELRTPTLFNRRARIFRAVLPPDQLNPDGYFDGDLTAFMPTQRSSGGGRKGKPSALVTQDERAVFLPMPSLHPGDPSRTDVRLRDMQWTIEADSGARVTAVALPSTQPSFAYVFQEAERAGTLLVERCQALRVKPGKNFSLLKEGISVMSEDGTLVSKDMVVTANKPGRKVVVWGSAAQLPGPDSALARAAQGADAWVSGCVAPSHHVPAVDEAVACVSSAELGSLASSMQAQTLLLARFPTTGSAGGSLEEVVERAAEEARQAAGPFTVVEAAQDFWVQVFEKHEGPAPASDTT